MKSAGILFVSRSHTPTHHPELIHVPIVSPKDVPGLVHGGENSFIASIHEQLHFHRLPCFSLWTKREMPTKPITHLSSF